MCNSYKSKVDAFFAIIGDTKMIFVPDILISNGSAFPDAKPDILASHI